MGGPATAEPEEAPNVVRALKYMYWIATLLGMDYVFTISSGPNYFTRIDTSDPFNMHNSMPTKVANTQFSNAWTVWASGQFIGSVLSRSLSASFGWRRALGLYVLCMFAGNLMYTLADPSVAGSLRLAIGGKLVDGLGCGATALGIGYIPTMSARPPVASLRMSTFRLFVSVGMVVATAVSIGLGHVRFSLGGVQFNPGNSPAAVQVLACLPTLVLTRALVVEPPAEAHRRASPNPFAGWREQGVWSRQTASWLFFVFCYGLATSAANYFGPVFLAEQHWHQPEISLWLFLFQVAGLSSGLLAEVALEHTPLEHYTCIYIGSALVAAGLGLMMIGQSRPSMDHVQTIFLAGYLTLSGASTIFSMGLSPAFKSVLPKTAFATMMSAYKASVDLGKIPGPRWSNYAQQTLDSEYVAYVPLITAFVGVTFFVLACKPFLTAPHQARPTGAGTAPEILLARNQGDL